MRNRSKAIIKKIILGSISFIRGTLIPKAYKGEYDFFENIRANTYFDDRFEEAYLRSITHQLDKTLTFKEFRKMETVALAIAEASSKVKKDPNHDCETVAWCENVLNEYRNRSEGNLPTGGNLIKYDTNISNLLQEIIETRRSIRSYSSEPISKDILEKILRAGLWAPTGCNRQTIEYLVLEGKEDIRYCQRIAGEGYPFPSEARLAILVLVDPRNYSLPSQRHMAYLEAGAAIQNILLVAHSFGIGSCWLFWSGRGVSHRGFSKKFSLNPWLLPVSMVCLGYPDATPKFRPDRKDLSKSVHYLARM